MKVRDLKEALQNVPDDTEVVFQGNIQDDDDEAGEYTYTTSTGHLFSAFLRTETPAEFVLDCAITDSE